MGRKPNAAGEATETLKDLVEQYRSRIKVGVEPRVMCSTQVLQRTADSSLKVVERPGRFDFPGRYLNHLGVRLDDVCFTATGSSPVSFSRAFGVLSIDDVSFGRLTIVEGAGGLIGPGYDELRAIGDDKQTFDYSRLWMRLKHQGVSLSQVKYLQNRLTEDLYFWNKLNGYSFWGGGIPYHRGIERRVSVDLSAVLPRVANTTKFVTEIGLRNPAPFAQGPFAEAPTYFVFLTPYIRTVDFGPDAEVQGTFFGDAVHDALQDAETVMDELPRCRLRGDSLRGDNVCFESLRGDGIYELPSDYYVNHVLAGFKAAAKGMWLEAHRHTVNEVRDTIRWFKR